MSIRDRIGVYDQTEFADNPEARCSIVLILDVSGSMAGAKIDTVNRALVKFRDIIREDSVTALRADVAIIAFDHEARVVRDFTNGAYFEAPTLEVSGGTNYSNAVNTALDLIEARKQSYREGGIAYYRSLAYFLTDGCPMHDNEADLARTATRLTAMEENRGVAFFSFIISDTEYLPIATFLTDPTDPEKFFRLIGISPEATYSSETGYSPGMSFDAPASNPFSASNIFSDLRTVAKEAGMSVAELIELGVREGAMRPPLPDFLLYHQERFYQLIGTSYEKLYYAGAFGQGSEGATGINLHRVAEVVDMSVTKLVELGVREQVLWTPISVLSKLAPRPPVELANMEQLDGSIQWLSRSVAAVSQSQPGEGIRLPEPDYLNF